MRFLWLSTPMLLAACPALAAAPAPPKAEAAVQEITVTGQSRDGLRVETDRRSFGISGDLQTTTGSIGDALRNVPSVSVDVQGNVALRGDPNVTILVDGQPSGQFRGEGRASALQNLPADQFERVEVITTPSAEFKPDGSGIINLISKKVRKPGYSGTMRASYGSEGRDTAGISGGYNSGKLTLSGDASLRRDPQKFLTVETREGLDPAGGLAESRNLFQARGHGRIVTGRMAADYDLDPKTRISAEVRGNQMDIRNGQFTQEVGRDGSGAVVRLYDRVGRLNFTRSNEAATASYRRKFANDSDLTVSLRLERTEMENRNSAGQITRLPTLGISHEFLPLDNREDELALKADYVRPLTGGGKLKAGVELGLQDYDFDFMALRGADPGSLAVVPSLDNSFRYDFVSPASYVTLERPFGKLTALAGLRLQSVDIDLIQRVTGETGGQTRVNVYPSLHLSYPLNDEQQVTLAYSRRINRANPDELNPLRIYIDASNVRVGNPDLKPMQIDAFEAAWQLRKGPTYYLATVFYRASRDVPSDVFTDLGGGVLLRSRDNIGERKAGGLELVANGRITPKLTYNVSGNVFWNEIDAGNLGFADKRSDVAVGGRGSLNWQVTPKDFLQANAFVNSEQLTAQGRIKASGILNLGYRRKITDDLSLVVTAQDVLKTTAYEVVIDTPDLLRKGRSEANVRAVFIGFTWAFGGEGKRPKDPGFDFGVGPTGG